VLKVGIVGAIAALALFPKLDELSALVGTPPADLIPQIADIVMTIAQRSAIAYLFIAALDFIWQRYRHEKQLRMDKGEIKQEFKQQGLPAEIKSAQKRRAMELSRARMMDAVPTADVIVTNPTHYSVALKYDSGSPAPIVVAKGVDNLAFKIREAATDAGVMIVPDPPLARTLYANVEVGRQIPEDLFQAVAQLLAYVYRVAGARKAAVAA
jgi:flagellar biosynthesis protein FlhB